MNLKNIWEDYVSMKVYVVISSGRTAQFKTTGDEKSDIDMKCETIFISAIICSVIKQTNCKPSGKRADEEHGLATNEEVTGEHKMTFTKSQQLKALFDKGIARGESEKTKEREDIKTHGCK